MGRQLPWAQNALSGTTRPLSTSRISSSRADHAETALQKNNVGNRGGLIEVTTIKSNPQHKRATSRSPSTSPPPGPPPISPLRPGYDNDDLYIMVEDEFCSIAQSYTAHLHHAEYKRLMRKAKEAPPKEISDLSPSKPRDARDRVRRDALRQRQHSALDQLTGRNVTAARPDSNDDEHDGEALDGEGIPERKKRKNKPNLWRGTSLAGLMDDNEQIKTSLVGLDRLPSSTRAAKGYGKGETESSRAVRRTNGDNLDIFTSTGRRGRNGYNDSIDMSQSLANEDDEQDAWGRHRKAAAQKAHVPQSNALASDDDQNQRTIKLSPRTRTKISSLARSKRSFLDESDEDGLDEKPLFDAPSAPSRRAKNVTSSILKSAKDNKKDRRSRLDEVPVFMF